jgi:hypothetical protein
MGISGSAPKSAKTVTRRSLVTVMSKTRNTYPVVALCATPGTSIDLAAQEAAEQRRSLYTGHLFLVFNDHAIQVFEGVTSRDIIAEYNLRTSKR